MVSSHKENPRTKQAALPADSRAALQWFVNNFGLYFNACRGLLLCDWDAAQEVTLEAAIINLKTKGQNPVVISGEALYKQADYIWQESSTKATFGNPFVSKMESELSKNPLVIVENLTAPKQPWHIWYLLSFLLYPRASNEKPTIFTTPLSYPEFKHAGYNCPDKDFLGEAINWEKCLWLLEASTISQDLFKVARLEGLPPMLRAEYYLYRTLKDRKLEITPQYIVGDYLLNFAILGVDRRLAIGCDLLSALSTQESFAKQAQQDAALLSQGWQILKFTPTEILANRTLCADAVDQLWRSDNKQLPCGRLVTNTEKATLVLPESYFADEQQKTAIECHGGPVALVGGPGTGKTLCTAYRAAFLVKSGINPENILIMTASPEASWLLKHQLEKIIDRQFLQCLAIFSWQDFGMKVLKENLSVIKRKPPLKIESNPQKIVQKLITKARKETDVTMLDLSGELEEFYVSAVISMYKTHMISPKIAKEEAQAHNEEVIAKIYQAYEEQLQKANRIDKDDVITLCTQTLLDNKELRTKYQSAYEFVLVDEYQDVTMAQDILARMLAAPQDNFWVTGDEEETIGESRNACPELLSEFSLRYPQAQCVILEKNWRCHPNIVAHAAKLATAIGRKKIMKNLVSAWQADPSMVIIGPQACKDEQEETLWVAQQIAALIAAQRAPNELAIIYRQEYYKEIIEGALRQQGLSFRVKAGDSPLVPDEVQDIAAFLQLIVDPDGPKARESFERVCQLGTKEIDPKLSATIAGFAEANTLSYLKAIEIYAEATADESCRELEQLVRIIRAMNQDKLPPAESIGYLRRARRLNDYYKNIKLPPGTIYEPLKKLNELEEQAHNFTSVPEFLKYIEQHWQEKSEVTDDTSISIRSVFEARGSEYPIVFLVGLASGIFPKETAQDLEEERRLFYVALTRAREGVYLSYPKQARGKLRAPSEFLTEAGFLAEEPGVIFPQEPVQTPVSQGQSLGFSPVTESKPMTDIQPQVEQITQEIISATPTYQPEHLAQNLSTPAAQLEHQQPGNTNLVEQFLEDNPSFAPGLQPYVIKDKPVPRMGNINLPPSKQNGFSQEGNQVDFNTAATPDQAVSSATSEFPTASDQGASDRMWYSAADYLKSTGTPSTDTISIFNTSEFSAAPHTGQIAEQIPDQTVQDYTTHDQAINTQKQESVPVIEQGLPCVACKQELESGAKFCSNCGSAQTPQVRLCSVCGNVLEPDAKFCGECGTPQVN